MKALIYGLVSAGLTTTTVAASSFGPEIWAHRGATYLSYENTLEAFELGKELGATGFELDLVLTGDNELAVYHDLTLNESTNVEELFDASRARDDGGFYVEDFTMDELRTLTLEVSPNDEGVRNELATDPDNPFGVAPDYVFRIPTYAEALDLLDTTASGQKVLTEVKLPDDGGTSEARTAIIDNLVAEWTDRGYTSDDSPIVVQSFSYAFMSEIDAVLETTDLNVPTFQLDALMLTLPDAPETQEDLNSFIASELGGLDGIALFQGLYLIDEPPFGSFVNPNGLDFVEAAMLAGLETYVWTLSKPDDVELGTYYDWLVDPATLIDFGDSYAEFYDLGLDGIITDTPDIAVATYAQYVENLAAVPLPASGTLLVAGMGLLAFRRKVFR